MEARGQTQAQAGWGVRMPCGSSYRCGGRLGATDTRRLSSQEVRGVSISVYKVFWAVSATAPAVSMPAEGRGQQEQSWAGRSRGGLPPSEVAALPSPPQSQHASASLENDVALERGPLQSAPFAQLALLFCAHHFTSETKANRVHGMETSCTPCTFILRTPFPQ